MGRAAQRKQHEEAELNLDKGFTPTFGRGSLAFVADFAASPSTLAYKERVALAADPLLRVELAKLYNNPADSATVWERLTTDATVRRGLVEQRSAAAARRQRCGHAGGGLSQQSPCAEAEASVGTSGVRRHTSSSGFVRNNGSVLTTQERQRQKEAEEPQLDALHLLTLKSFKKKHPIEFWGAVRPGAQTTNQTLRMLGLYEEDGFMTSTMGMRAPVGVPKGFVPDVKRTGAANVSSTGRSGGAAS